MGCFAHSQSPPGIRKLKTGSSPLRLTLTSKQDLTLKRHWPTMRVDSEQKWGMERFIPFPGKPAKLHNAYLPLGVLKHQEFWFQDKELGQESWQLSFSCPAKTCQLCNQSPEDSWQNYPAARPDIVGQARQGYFRPGNRKYINLVWACWYILVIPTLKR